MLPLAQWVSLFSVLVVALLLGGARLAWMVQQKQAIDWPATFAAIASVAQTIAFVCAGVWTYGLFIKQRLDRKRVDVSVAARVAARDSKQLLLRVHFDVRNVGHVEISPHRAEVRVSILRRSGQEIAIPAKDDGSAHSCDTMVNSWPELVRCKIPLGPEKLILEPGESERYPLDVIVPAGVDVVQVLAVLRADETEDGLYWDDLTVVDLTETPSVNRAAS